MVYLRNGEKVLDLPSLEQLVRSFAKIAMLEINLPQSGFVQSADRSESVTQYGPAQLQHFAMTRREWMSRKPSGGQSNSPRRLGLTEIIRNQSDLFQFARGRADLRADVGEIGEGTGHGVRFGCFVLLHDGRGLGAPRGRFRTMGF